MFFHPERRVSTTQLAAFSLFATCLLFQAITNIKFLFTKQLPKVDIESFAELSALLDKIRKTSGYQMCPGIKDFDEILEDVRIQPANVDEEL